MMRTEKKSIPAKSEIYLSCTKSTKVSSDIHYLE